MTIERRRYIYFCEHMPQGNMLPDAMTQSINQTLMNIVNNG
ncbi:MAG: hypothetical protein RL489_196 [Pseudomonadota bacterium]